MRSPGSPYVFDSPPNVMPFLVKSHAGSSDGALPCSRPRYISSWKRCAPAPSQIATTSSHSSADGSAPVGLCGKLVTTSRVRPGSTSSRNRSGAKRGFSMPSGVHGVIRAPTERATSVSDW